MDGNRQGILGAALVAAILLGLLVEAMGDGPPPASSAAQGRRLIERAVFCPPSAGRENQLSQVAAAPATGASALLEVSPGPARPQELGAGNYLLHRSDAGGGINVVGYGAPPGATAAGRFEGSVKGTASAACSPVTSTNWYFAFGSSLLGYDERILVYNPLPEDAVINVVFVTPRGERAPANAADVAVPAGRSQVLKVNEFILREPVLSAVVTAARGRVAAWRVMVAAPENQPEGAQMSLGATAPSTEWYFPQGGVAEGIDERIALLNPSRQEAVVSILLATEDQMVQPPGLAQIKLAPETSMSLSLRDAVTRQQASIGEASAVVRSTNDVPVVAERVTSYSREGLGGVEAEVGARRAATRWLLGPSLPGATTDRVAVFNPGSTQAAVSISLLTVEGRPLAPRWVARTRVRGGLRREVVLGGRAGEPVMALVESTAPVVAERLSYSPEASDVASVIGPGAAFLP